MAQPLNAIAMAQLFLEARSTHDFSERAVTEDTLRRLYELVSLGPTAFNSQPARYVFLRSRAQRERLAPALSSSNRDKTVAATVTVLVAYERRFHQHLPTVFPAYDARGLFESAPALAQQTAERNAALQAGYLILAARSLGLAAGPMSGFDAAQVEQLFFAEQEAQPILIVNLGYARGAVTTVRGPRLAFDQVARIL